MGCIYTMYIKLPDQSNHAINLFLNELPVINIKILKNDMVLKEAIIPISCDGNNRPQCLNIKLDSSA